MQKVKLVYLIADDGLSDDVVSALKELDIQHYTRWSGVEGVGRTGPRQGSPIWPGLNEVFLLALEPERVQPLVDTLHAIRDSYPITPGLRFIITDAELI
ncbi:MAG: hypothetical protein HPY44_00180 [Armatimonadetes bacterium]|nr:hypothetical protein [Armatimonadota bacterium]